MMLRLDNDKPVFQIFLTSYRNPEKENRKSTIGKECHVCSTLAPRSTGPATHTGELSHAGTLGPQKSNLPWDDGCQTGSLEGVSELTWSLRADPVNRYNSPGKRATWWQIKK
jgi:hypothetical protein